MNRLTKIKIMAIELNEMINDPQRVNQLTNEYTNLKRYVEKQRRLLEQLRDEQRELTPLDEFVMLPAFEDIGLNLLRSLRGNAKPDNKMKQIIKEIPDRIDYWLEQINSHNYP